MSSSKVLSKLKEETSKISEQHEKERKYYEKEAAEEASRKKREDAYYYDDNDRLSFLDFYKMSSFFLSYPNLYMMMGFFMANMLYFTPQMFDFKDILERYIPWGWQTFLIALGTTYGIPIILNLVRALQLWYIFSRLPFKLNGLGLLVHRCKDQRYFRRCSVRLAFDEESKAKPNKTLKEIKHAILELLCSEANKIMFLKRIRRWKIENNLAEGFASWRVSRIILMALNKHLTPVQLELGNIKSVEIEFPVGHYTSDDRIEWLPQGDLP